jgi:hypothetical protein
VPRPAGSARTAVLALALLAMAAVPAAAGDHAQFRLTKAGMAAARAVQITRSDLPPTNGWTGHVDETGSASSDSGPACDVLHPRRSDLVVIGDAGVQWAHTGFQLRTAAQVLQSARMVDLDWRRSLAMPQFLECMREAARKSGDPAWHLVSLNRLPFPAVGAHTAAFRALYDVDTAVERLMVDAIFFSRGRTEITLTTVVPISAATPIRLVQTELARRLERRVRL